MPAHIDWKDDHGKNGWYLVDGYLVRSFKTKSKTHALALLKQYNEKRLGIAPCPTVQKYYDEWIKRQVPPLVRKSRERDHKQLFNRHILPRFKHTELDRIKTADLRVFQSDLLKGGLKVKTARNAIDSSFRAMYKDARADIPALEGKDPFMDLKWPKAKRLPPEPMTVEEKGRILAAFAEHEPFYYPFVRFQFDTGARPSETIALTWADLNPVTRRVSINKSRHLGVDNDHPKTTHSDRPITISRDLMDLLQALRHPWSQETDKVFSNKEGTPIVADNFRHDQWGRVLASLRIKKRKFYATRHTFITQCVQAGYPLKQIADYAGTSVAMIEQHYCARQELDPDKGLESQAGQRKRAAETREILERFSRAHDFPSENLASPTGFEPVLSA
jgi:integrase